MFMTSRRHIHPAHGIPRAYLKMCVWYLGAVFPLGSAKHGTQGSLPAPVLLQDENFDPIDDARMQGFCKLELVGIT
eukprot:jgi/Botrbrau1/7381/Bobra.0316s0024.1